MSERMKAVVQDRYGPPEVLRIEEVERPVPQDDEVLIRVRASTVTQTDAHVRGQICSSGASSSDFAGRGGARSAWSWPARSKPPALPSGNSSWATRSSAAFDFFGAHAEYICLSESAALAHKPAGMSFDEAAAVCDGASQALGDAATGRCPGRGRRRRLRRVRLPRHGGGAAGQALRRPRHGRCGTDHVELVRSLGADEVVDYLREDFTKTGQTYDAIIDAVGKYSFLRGRRALKPGGVYVATDGGRFLLETFGLMLVTRWVGTKRVRRAGSTQQAGCPVPEGAHRGGELPGGHRSALPDGPGGRRARYVETWQKAGNVVLHDE